jgi:hypothetical protein
LFIRKTNRDAEKRIRQQKKWSSATTQINGFTFGNICRRGGI